MAYADVYPAGARDHVIAVNDQMLAELQGRNCPRCGCAESRPIKSDFDDGEVAGLPLRVCVACQEVFGFDDSTSVPDHLLPHAEKSPSGGIWDNDDDELAACPRQSSPCFRDAGAAAAVDWSSGNEDEALSRDHGQHHPDFSEPPRSGRGRGRRGCRGGCGKGRGRRHHQDEERSHHHRNHHHHGCGRGQRGRGGNGSHGGVQTSSNDSDPWKQVAATCLESGSRCLWGVAGDLVAGRYDEAVATATDEMEPVGRAVGSVVGSVAGNLIGSSRAGELGAEMGSTVGRGVAEMLKDSSLCSRRSSSDND